MATRRTFTIEQWRHWGDEIDAAARRFSAAFAVYPNIMLANSWTYGRVDMMANNVGREHIHGDEGQHPEEGDYAGLSTFVGDGYELAFCLDEALANGDISLIHDDDPDGDGEPIPEDTPLPRAATGTGPT
jgi:hypothetical protein